MELQRYESLAQAAERTGISRKTLRRRIASGQLPVFSSGRAHPPRPSRGRRRDAAPDLARVNARPEYPGEVPSEYD